MNHAALGLFEDNPRDNTIRILLPTDILRPLGVTEGALLQAIYYPRPPLSVPLLSRDGGFDSRDLMISPIPFRLWPRVTMLRVRLSTSVPNALPIFSRFLSEHGCSILVAQFARSTYNYATWNIIVVFDDLRVSNFDKSVCLFEGTMHRVDQLRELIATKCKPILYAIEHHSRLETPFNIWPLPALAYYYNFVTNEASPRFRPFRLFYKAGRLVSMPDESSRAVMNHIFSSESSKTFTALYSQMDTRDMAVRISTIPNSVLPSFFFVTFSFTRNGLPDTSRGFMAHVANNLPPKYRIWRVYNHTVANEEATEIGVASLLVQDTDPINLASNQCYSSAVQHFKKMAAGGFAAENGSPFELSVRVESLTTSRIRDLVAPHGKTGMDTRYEYDIFISYSTSDKDDARVLADMVTASGLTPYLAERALKGGDEWSKGIRDALVSSRELCVLCSRATLKSVWVATEWGAAWVLNRRITPLLLSVESSELPERLQACQHRPFHRASEYIHEVLERKHTHIEDALCFE